MDNALKRRMINVLSQIGGLCRGLPEFNIARLHTMLSRKEAGAWCKLAREAATQLREFDNKLRDYNDESNERIASNDSKDSSAAIETSPSRPEAASSINA